MDSKKPNIKHNSFSGAASKNVDTFLKKYNWAASINEWAEDDKTQFSVAFLEGAAVQFLKMLMKIF